MARRGGFQGGMPGNMNNLMKQAQKMQRQMEVTQKEMEEKGYLQKIASEEDGRVTYITVTKKGSELSQKYDEQYFDSLLPYMEEIPDEDAECMIQTIEKFYQIMCERRKHYDER